MKKLLVQLSCHPLDIVLGAIFSICTCRAEKWHLASRQSQPKKSGPTFRAAFLKVVLDEDSKPVFLALSKVSSAVGRVNGAARLPKQCSSFALGTARGASFLGSSLLPRDDTGPRQRWKASHYPEAGGRPGESRQRERGQAKWPLGTAKGFLDH